MTPEALFERLEITAPADFQYFEQLADLMEAEENIDFDLFYTVLSEVSSETMGELIEYYMNEMSEALPSNGENLLTTFESVKQRLLLLCENLEDQDTRRTFAEELYRFREWFTGGGMASVNGRACSVFEAIMNAREEAVTKSKESFYDFSRAMGYQVEELSMSLGAFSPIDVVASADECDCGDDCSCGHHHEHCDCDDGCDCDDDCDCGHHHEH